MDDQDKTRRPKDDVRWSDQLNPLQARRSTPVIPPEVTAKIQAPIVINDCPTLDVAGDLEVYATLRAAEQALEADDVQGGDFHAFDSRGRLLTILPDWMASCVRFEPATDEPEHSDVLIGLLRQHLRQQQRPTVEIEAMSTDEMLTAILAWQSTPSRRPGLWGAFFARIRTAFGG